MNEGKDEEALGVSKVMRESIHVSLKRNINQTVLSLWGVCCGGYKAQMSSDACDNNPSL